MRWQGKLMQVTYIGLSEYFERCIPQAKREGYLFIIWLIDKSIMERVQLVTDLKKRPDEESDNIRIYVPLDLNRNAILRRLDSVIYHYGETNEENELDFSMDIEMIISQIEIYDQVWFGRHMPKNGKHSLEAKTLVREFVERLEEIPDGCAERFPFETIDRLREEYLEE